MRLHLMPAALAVLSLILLPCSPAAAAAEPPRGRPTDPVPCFGAGCDGKDPVHTGCTANAWTVSYGGALVRARAYDGYVELRYGPGELVNDLKKGRRRSCQVNWARFLKQGQGADYIVWVERVPPIKTTSPISDWELTRYLGGDQGTGVIYSDQVYAPAERARACVAPAGLSAAGRGQAAGRGGAARPPGTVCTRAV
ncbi:hypothetical protein ACWEPN_30500 [Nonomuraea wenchangensis]